MKFPISHTAVFLSPKTESILKSLSSNEINHLLSLSIQKLSKVLPKSTVFLTRGHLLYNQTILIF
ncbi:hypothetical protein LEP1GSC116_3350 [Leptospira interrogans serovar Icterohaemorrhagiae str. Verdun HP]|uniref:Uncharacterized protein n=7 Tax=Leptospira interrogans TaxID=173 RepID=M3GRC0_LEPIR|nr:hypothetical protein LEP1GSC151_1846 [Leptospira interrogans serovar Grippotyphosa str. LT2186]EMM81746.1 hypothetical protein LEP1GSC037_3244 [Leptospira interrogans str. 2006001854]EMN31494.1 hypothetical protein LEP1GSC083_4744 [Leptospira interrogans serovar Pyrogenes str. L0374]EMO06197.1 hypothetical protein LEP1GSC116_3350 [Leptospira interrogans serovar Icterohaemorrhagiae str. Verdun HP]EMP05137.1 hypothetical protein LEP1GSC124_0339 [Leptospira interrogans serovar Pyrogenes str. 20